MSAFLVEQERTTWQSTRATLPIPRSSAAVATYTQYTEHTMGPLSWASGACPIAGRNDHMHTTRKSPEPTSVAPNVPTNASRLGSTFPEPVGIKCGRTAGSVHKSANTLKCDVDKVGSTASSPAIVLGRVERLSTVQTSSQVTCGIELLYSSFGWHRSAASTSHLASARDMELDSAGTGWLVPR